MQFDISEAVQHWGVYSGASIAIRYGSELVNYRKLNHKIEQIVTALSGFRPGSGRIGLMVL